MPSLLSDMISSAFAIRWKFVFDVYSITYSVLGSSLEVNAVSCVTSIRVNDLT
eukprot:m.333563 g.333563  ORF g.333563 m.333563 type:complete len:53 (+) comp16522_c0_seq6:985-1143(+)